MNDPAVRFLDDAHRNGHRGPTLLRRWAMLRNGSRRIPGERVTTATLNEAIRIEQESNEDSGS